MHAFACEVGRDPGRLDVIYLAGTHITDSPLDDAKRDVLSGRAAQVRADVGRLREVGGVTEIITGNGGDSIAALLGGLERVRGAVG